MGKVKPRLFKPVSKDPTVPTRLWPLKVGHTEGTGLHCENNIPEERSHKPRPLDDIRMTSNIINTV